MSDDKQLAARVAALERALSVNIDILINVYGALIALRWRQGNQDMEKKIGEEIEHVSKGLDELIRHLGSVDP